MLSFGTLINMLFLAFYKILEFFARKLGHNDFAMQMAEKAERCDKKAHYYEGMGPWPEK